MIAMIESGKERAEKGLEVVHKFMTDGPGALWDWAMEKISDIQGMVTDAILGWIRWEAIEKGIITLISMLNPASGVVKLVKSAWDAIQFFITNADKIKKWLTTLYDSIMAILTKNVGKVAGAIEGAIGMGIPLTIDLVLRIIGVDIVDGVKKAFNVITQKIENAWDWVMEKIVKVVKKFLGKVIDKAVALYDKAKEKVEEVVDKVKDRVSSWLGIKKKFNDKAGHAHTLYVNEKNEVIVASNPERIDRVLNKVENAENKNQVDDAREVASKLTKASAEEKSAEKEQKADKQKEADTLSTQLVNILRDILYGDGVKETMEKVTITFDIKGDATEFKRQLSLQETEINKMKVGEWQTARTKYIAFGRDAADTKSKRKKALKDKLLASPEKSAMALVNQNAIKPGDVDFLKTLLNSSESANRTNRIKSFINTIINSYSSKDLAVLHALDQVAGGNATQYGDEHTIFGDAEVNSNIGSQWPSRVTVLDEASKGVIRTALMNVIINPKL